MTNCLIFCSGKYPSHWKWRCEGIIFLILVEDFTFRNVFHCDCYSSYLAYNKYCDVTTCIPQVADFGVSAQLTKTMSRRKVHNHYLIMSSCSILLRMHQEPFKPSTIAQIDWPRWLILRSTHLWNPRYKR